MKFCTFLAGCGDYETTESIEVKIPPDAASIIITLGSSSQTVELTNGGIGSIVLTPSEDELGRTNTLLIEFKDSDGNYLKGSEVIREVYVSESGDTDISLKFAPIAHPYIRVDVSEGVGRSEVNVKGWNFAGEENVEVFFGENRVANTMTDAEGSFDTIFEVSNDVLVAALEGGVSAWGVTSKRVATVSLITEPRIVVEPDSGTIGAGITLRGWNFSGNEDVNIEFGGKAIVDVQADASGGFEALLIVPDYASTGTTSILVTGLKSNRVAATAFAVFTVGVPYVAVYPSTVSIGEEVTVIGSGFGEIGVVVIELGGREVAKIETDLSGSFEQVFTIPENTPVGTTLILARGLESGQTAETLITIRSGDMLPPTLDDGACDPRNGAGGVSPIDYAEGVEIAFSEPVAEVKVISKDPNFTSIEELSKDGKFLTILFLKFQLPEKTRVRIVLSAEDLAGNVAELEYWFVTK